MALESPNPEGLVLGTAYRNLRGTLLGFLFKQTGDAHAAEDLLHDVMLKVLASEKAGRPASDNLGG